MITNAFTCSGHYAILIMLGIKRVENRSMCPEPVKGRCAVSCSKKFCKEEYGNFIQWASQALSAEDFALIPAWCDVKDWPGKVVGCVDYSARSRGEGRESWDEKKAYFWDLREVVCFDEPIPCRGNTGMWQMQEGLATVVSQTDELARRDDVVIKTPEDAAKLFRAALPIVGTSEGFFVLPLDNSDRPKSMPVLVSLGTTSCTTAVQPKDVFAEVFKADADRFIVAHNHPHGTLQPSEEDVRITKMFDEMAKNLGVKMLDHIILGHGEDFAVIKRS